MARNFSLSRLGDGEARGKIATMARRGKQNRAFVLKPRLVLGVHVVGLLAMAPCYVRARSWTGRGSDSTKRA